MKKQTVFYTALAVGLILNMTNSSAQTVTQTLATAQSALSVKPDQVLADLTRPVAAIKAKVASLGQPELLAYANTYKTLILNKKEQLSGLTAALKSLPMSDLFSAKGKAIKNQLSQYTSQLTGLKQRYGVYLDQLKALGVDLSSFGI